MAIQKGHPQNSKNFSATSIKISVFITLTAFSLSACSLFPGAESHSEGGLAPVLRALEGKAPLALSEKNGYLAPNTLVALLQSTSLSIQGFIDSRGVPDAVRVLESEPGAGAVDFYYLAPDELYHAEQSGAVWVVLGPDPIQREFVVPLRQAVRNRMRLQEEVAAVQEEAKKVAQPTPTEEQSKPVSEVAPVLNKTETFPTENDPFIQRINNLYKTTDNKTQNTEVTQTSLLQSRQSQLRKLSANSALPYSKQNDKGDVLHRVTSDQERFDTIAAWFTHDPKNELLLIRVNGKLQDQTLKPGELVLVPSYLVKNRKVLQPGMLNEIDAAMNFSPPINQKTLASESNEKTDGKS